MHDPPGVRLRNLINDAKAKDPGLTDSAVAKALGITQPGLIGYFNGDKPKYLVRVRIEAWTNGEIKVPEWEDPTALRAARHVASPLRRRRAAGEGR